MPREQQRTITELAARQYLADRERIAREQAAAAGVPYGSETVSEDKAYELFYQRDPDADEQRAWLEAAAAVAAGKLPEDRVASYVIEKVFPARIAVTEGGGRTDLKSQAAFVKRMVERRRREMGVADEPAPTDAPEPEQEGY